MSESDYQQLVERMLENVASPMISSDTGVECDLADGNTKGPGKYLDQD